tara:strand:- start:38 stop:217 length:180 start_codon:yes stop_codon:yes gene_type:complete
MQVVAVELVFLESEDQVVQVVVDVLDQDLLTEAQEEQELLEQLILVAAVEQEIIQDLLM